MTQLRLFMYVEPMSRFVKVFAIFVMVFAVSGIHDSVAASVEQSASQHYSSVAELDIVPSDDSQMCCPEMGFTKHSPHDHCNVSCAIIPSATIAVGSWKLGKISEFRTDGLYGNNFDLLKRPPKKLI